MRAEHESSCAAAFAKCRQLSAAGYYATIVGFTDRAEAVRWIRDQKKSGKRAVALFTKFGTDDRNRLVFSMQLPPLESAIRLCETLIRTAAERGDFRSVERAVNRWRFYVDLNKKRKR